VHLHVAGPRLSRRVKRVLLVGPTSASWDSIAAEVQGDLDRLQRPGVELTYRCTGAGPVHVHTDDDAAAAAPHVVATIVAAQHEGFDGVIVDCTADPGVVESRRQVHIPVVGAGGALRAAIAAAPHPVWELTGDDLRSMTAAEIVARAAGAATVALGATGYSHLVDELAAALPRVTVLDPLAVALGLLIPAV
jgi:Asp/Glu/hydantoin racemase